MDIYPLLNVLHVGIAVAWVGAGLGAMLLTTRAARSGNDTALVAAVADSAYLASRVFMPGGAAVLASGLWLAWSGDNFGEAWVLLGLAGTLCTAGIGGGLLGPLSRKVAELGATAAGIAAAHRLARVHRGDVILLFVIVWDMVARPAWSNWVQLLLMLALITAALLIHLRPLLPGRASA
ncbi:hypothetical protein [Frigidibacter sp. ROC022]|uniref:hypothetical protein n=1 Tax=Frigidibacter sp. ROC022 TaxID=2971796 RepID=UPI00215AE0DD|nr:hypothetical protein [Frigidibacter sp. ROC022]MCR8722904.1 hypothetical protein [Frigidibacter sp. ROC022]